MEHKWKELAIILNCPYKKKFTTNGWGQFEINNKGLYSYENNEYCDSGSQRSFDNLELFLSGKIWII